METAGSAGGREKGARGGVEGKGGSEGEGWGRGGGDRAITSESKMKYNLEEPRTAC